MPSQPTPKPTDRWSLWFFRLVQTVGLAIGVYEVKFTAHAQISVLLYSAALILGSFGLKLLLHGAQTVVSAASDLLEEEQDE